MAEEKDYIWTRREGETSRAYEAFRHYLNLGPKRTLRAAVEMDGRSVLSVFENWSSKNDWVGRCEAYDRHMDTAATDGLTSQLSTVREKHIVLADRLLDHLNDRLDDFISKRQDPSMRWIQAFATAAKVQQGAFLMRDTDKTSDLLNSAMDLLERLEKAESKSGDA